MKKIIWQNCDFKIGAVSLDDIPVIDFSEIAFAGRSNVGKSSLVNALTGRNTLSRISKKPGCTKQLNFFLLDEKIMLVDMPGYGYAEAGKREIRGWGRLIKEYLAGRVNLKRVFLLIDARHGLKPNDIKIMGLLDEKAVSYQIVLTKADKVTKEELNKITSKIHSQGKKHPALHPHIIITSSRDKTGIEDIRGEIVEFL